MIFKFNDHLPLILDNYLLNLVHHYILHHTKNNKDVFLVNILLVEQVSDPTFDLKINIMSLFVFMYQVLKLTDNFKSASTSSFG